jgi:hypothetical protein
MDIEDEYKEIPSRKVTQDTTAHMTNITNTISFSFNNSKNSSPSKDRECPLAANTHSMPNMQNQGSSQKIDPEDIMKIKDIIEYKDYLAANNMNPGNDCNHYIYEDNYDLINLKDEEDDFSYSDNNNQNIFNFEDYFTV